MGQLTLLVCVLCKAAIEKNEVDGRQSEYIDTPVTPTRPTPGPVQDTKQNRRNITRLLWNRHEDGLAVCMTT